jgi:hypothetical protein
MANDILTATRITREMQKILHQELSFVGTINRQYDNRFVEAGWDGGSSIQIRLPNEYTVRTGKTLNAQDVTEASETLVVATQKGVDMNFSSAELSTDIRQFKERHLIPAMTRLAADIEADALSMYKDVYQERMELGAAVSLAHLLNVQKKLTDSLTPMTPRCLQLTTQDNVDLVVENKLFLNDRAKVSKQFRKGLIGNQYFGFDDVYQNTLLPLHTTGTDDGTGDYVLNGAGQTGASLTVQTGAGTFKKGDIVNLDAVYAVHPESKVSTGVLKTFVLTADTGVSATTLPISPAIVTTGAKQNVDAGPADGVKVNKEESDGTDIGASADYYIGLAYHKDAFAFATADMEMPKGVDFSARHVLDGISMRIVRQYDINNDNMPCRVDILYGYKTVRPQMACRIGMN